MDENGVAAGQCQFWCGTAAETLEWIKAIIEFIRPYNFLITAQVVNFFTDRLWEALDEEWMDCLRNEPVQHLLLIPSGVVQDHWPPSLKLWWGARFNPNKIQQRRSLELVASAVASAVEDEKEFFDFFIFLLPRQQLTVKDYS